MYDFNHEIANIAEKDVQFCSFSIIMPIYIQIDKLTKKMPNESV